MSNKAAYKAFYKKAKYTLKEVRDKFPAMSTDITMILLVLKTTKHVGRTLPQRYFKEMLQAPFGDRMRARDVAFFMSDAFNVESFESFVARCKEQWKLLSIEDQELIWGRVDELLDASDACSTPS